MNNIYGYARVSSKEQNEERQIIALKGQKKKRRIYTLTKYPVRISTDRCIRK